MGSDLEKEQHLPFEKIWSLSNISPQDLTQLCHWNATVPSGMEECVHESIQRQCLLRPTAEAISSWDGNFTFNELDDLSCRLAKYLTSVHVGPEVLVPLCFEKSKWTVVSMLAVMKAGGACVMMDTSHPIDRIREIMRECQATVILASPQNAELVKEMAHTLVVVSKSTMSKLPPAVGFSEPSVRPDNVAFVVFTSGSTGKPKGIILEHVNLNTSTRDFSTKMENTADERVLQFSSYAFDTSIYEIVSTLIYGGCVCIPSETEKMNSIAHFIRAHKVNSASFTPSALSILRPEDVPGLKTMGLGGEPITRNNIAIWANKLQLFTGYGTSECTVCAVDLIPEHGWEVGTLGHMLGGVAWIVDPLNVERLMPVGATGELVVEGAIVARGYLNNPEKTKESFIDPPTWLQAFRGAGSRRLYKTGDLMHYLPDGKLRYVGRKDTQRKVRGQRLELEEVENRVRQASSHVKDVVVDVLTPIGNSSKPILTAFIWPKQEVEHIDASQTPSVDTVFAVSDERFCSEITGLDLRLRDFLPSYMVPAAYVPLKYLPLSTVGKANRLLLRELGSLMTRIELDAYSPEKARKRPPLTEEETKLQLLWANRLGLKLEDIGADDSFFSLGGDSIEAMRLAEMAREEGLNLITADVMRHPKLSELALCLRTVSATSDGTIKPFALLGDDVTAQRITDLAIAQCAVERGSIEDIYACTAMQELLAPLLMNDGRSFVMPIEFEIPSTACPDRLNKAWESAIESLPILRTRLIQTEPGRWFQVVVKDSIECSRFNDLDSYRAMDAEKPMRLGGPLARIGIGPRHLNGGPQSMTLTMHHSIFDGWSISLILSQVQAAYYGTTLKKYPFAPFIEYLSKTDIAASKRFWNSEFANLNAVMFPPIPSPDYSPATDKSFEHRIQHLPHSATTFTLSTMIHFAWAMVLARLTKSEDVIFGITVSGRSAPVADIEHVVGPTVAVYPLRVSVPENQTIVSALQTVQTHAATLIPFEQIGLSNIAKLSGEAASACRFQNEIVVQPNPDAEDQDLFNEGGLDIAARRESALTGLALEFLIGPKAVELSLYCHFDSNLLSEKRVRRIVGHFEHILRHILEDPLQMIRDLKKYEDDEP